MRPFEQIRNDVCLHRLPVVLVGNGGGYGYGVMGATHHALEDYGAVLCLPSLRAYVPAFDGDLCAQIKALFEVSHPVYLRLGLSEEPAGAMVPPYAPWRKLQDGGGWTVLVVGTLVGGIWDAVRATLRGEPTEPVVPLRTAVRGDPRVVPCRPGAVAAAAGGRGARGPRGGGPDGRGPIRST